MPGYTEAASSDGLPIVRNYTKVIDVDTGRCLCQYIDGYKYIITKTVKHQELLDVCYPTIC